MKGGSVGVGRLDRPCVALQPPEHLGRAGVPWTDSQAIIAVALSVGGRTLPGIGTTNIARPGS
jgi:hypothetical protein